MLKLALPVFALMLLVGWAQAKVVNRDNAEMMDSTVPTMAKLPTATLTGRVEFESGRPDGKDFEIVATSAGNIRGHAVIKNDGSFRLEGLNEGECHLTLRSKPNDWILRAEPFVTAKAGEKTTIPPLVATRAAFIVGRTLDAETGKPVPYTNIGNSWYRSNRAINYEVPARSANTHSDAEGRYRLPVLPGPNIIAVVSAPPGYTEQGDSRENPISLNLKTGETKTVDFKMVPTVDFHGFAVDEKNQPVAGGRFYFRCLAPQASLPDPQKLRWDFAAQHAVTDATGDWQARGLRPGHYVLWGFREWQVKEPVTVVLPQTQPLKVVLRRLASVQATGHVVTQAGEPIADVEIIAAISKPEENRPQRGGHPRATYRRFKSDQTGQFVIDNLYADYKIHFRFNKPGYRFVSGGEVRAQNGALTFANIVMRQHNP